MYNCLSICVFCSEVQIEVFEKRLQSLDLSKVADVMDEFSSLALVHDVVVHRKLTIKSHNSHWQERTLNDSVAYVDLYCVSFLCLDLSSTKPMLAR